MPTIIIRSFRYSTYIHILSHCREPTRYRSHFVKLIVSVSCQCIIDYHSRPYIFDRVCISDGFPILFVWGGFVYCWAISMSMSLWILSIDDIVDIVDIVG